MSRSFQVAPISLDAPDNPIGPFSHQGAGCDLKGTLNGKGKPDSLSALKPDNSICCQQTGFMDARLLALNVGK